MVHFARDHFGADVAHCDRRRKYSGFPGWNKESAEPFFSSASSRDGLGALTRRNGRHGRRRKICARNDVPRMSRHSAKNKLRKSPKPIGHYEAKGNSSTVRSSFKPVKVHASNFTAIIPVISDARIFAPASSDPRSPKAEPAIAAGANDGLHADTGALSRTQIRCARRGLDIFVCLTMGIISPHPTAD